MCSKTKPYFEYSNTEGHVPSTKSHIRSLRLYYENTMFTLQSEIECYFAMQFNLLYGSGNMKLISNSVLVLGNYAELCLVCSHNPFL